MRICLISREYPPASGWGGIATYTYHQAHGLRDLGHDVEVIALAGGADEAALGGPDVVSGGEAPIVSQTNVEDDIVVHRVQPDQRFEQMQMIGASTPFTQYVLKSIFPLARKFFELHSAQPFDVAEAPEHLAEGLGLALTRAVPLVIRLHTPQSKLIAEGFHNLTASFDQQFVATLERLAMLSCDVITSPSEDMADYVAEDMAYPRDEIRIVRNPVDSDRFAPEGTKALDFGGKKIVLFVGRLEERKGVRYLIDAIPEVLRVNPEVHFVLIGSDTNNGADQKSVLQELEQSLAANGAASAVTFLSQVPLSKMPDYYRSADICVFPSLYDNAPCTCLEAMSSGKPVVTTSAGGSKEYVIDGECGLIVPPQDSASLVTAISSLLVDEERARQLGAAGRTRVLQQYNRKKIAVDSISPYKDCVAKFAAKNPNHALYLKPQSMLLQDIERLLQTYDKMLYDFLYVQSMEFRFKHRVKRMLGRRPAAPHRTTS